MKYLKSKETKLKKITKQEARRYFLREGYFFDKSVVPLNINLDGMEGIELLPINWKYPNKIPRTSSIDIIVDKNDRGLRRFSLIHPYIYIQLVNEIINEFKGFKERLMRKSSVNVYSIPMLNGKDNVSSDFRHFSIIDPSSCFLTHSYILSTDIYNFYESIYTHSISWALHGKEIAKNNVRDFKLLGNRLDKLFQNLHDGQTNGIPTGNILSDLVAELILKDIDILISATLKDLNVQAFRFRDDYRFACKNKRDARAVCDRLALILNREYGLTLNQNKTLIQTVERYRELCTRPEQLIELPFEDKTEIKIDWERLHRYVEESRALNRKIKSAFDEHVEKLMFALDGDRRHLVKEPSNDWAPLIFSSLIDCVDSGISSSSHTFLLIDFVLSEVDDTVIKDNLIEELYNRFVDSYNENHKLWAYAILSNHHADKAESFANLHSSPLFKMVMDNVTPHVDQFTTRDLLSDEAQPNLKQLKLVRAYIIQRIPTIEQDYLLNLLEENELESLSTKYYGGHR